MALQKCMENHCQFSLLKKKKKKKKTWIQWENTLTQKCYVSSHLNKTNKQKISRNDQKKLSKICQ